MSEQTTTRSPACPECESPVDGLADRQVGEIVECSQCGTELEVLATATNPPLLGRAPDVEEDWGE